MTTKALMRPAPGRSKPSGFSSAAAAGNTRIEALADGPGRRPGNGAPIRLGFETGGGDEPLPFGPGASQQETERRYMGEALRLARLAARSGEVPVGAIVVLEGTIVGSGFNRPIALTDPTAHAEVMAIRAAASRVGNYRLPGAWLVATLEPCLMCFGAALHARLARVSFGARDPRLGAAGLLTELQSRPASLNHALDVRGGILADESALLLRDFFAGRRKPSAPGARAVSGGIARDGGGRSASRR